MVYSSIWKPVIAEFNLAEVRYMIKKVSSEVEETIFDGIAHRAPDEDTIKINLNGICANFIDCECNSQMIAFTDFDLDRAIAQFKLYTYDSDNDEWILEETYEFLNDWSYSYNYAGGNGSLAFPVNGHYTTGMLVPVGSYTGGLLSIDFVVSTGSSCGDYALYYQNAAGSIDAFLIEGNVSKTDNFVHSTYEKPRGINVRESNVYMNTITETWACATGWLSDGEAAIFAGNVITSPQVWLYDIVNDKLIPVEITDSSVKYKTYRNEGKKLVNYTINIKASNAKYRNL